MNVTLNRKTESLRKATIHHAGSDRVINGMGNGRLDAVSNAIKHYFDIDYELAFYEEHSMTKGSSSKAVAYVGVICNKKRYWGVGIDADIIKASVEALVVAVNKIEELRNQQECKDARLLEITNYIYANYKHVTLDELSEKFFLSKPYLSKYIKEKSGMTFGDILKNVRMKKSLHDAQGRQCNCREYRRDCGISERRTFQPDL